MSLILTNAGPAKFLEVEYKFVLPDEDSFERFRSLLVSLRPDQQSHVTTTDTYYVLRDSPKFVYRHRFDQELQQLTVKSLVADPSVRMEVNLDLKTAENQAEAIQAFLGTMGIKAQSSLNKDLYVFYFPKVEIALYRARAGEHQVLCLELEAIEFDDVATAKNEIDEWCQKIGIKAEARECRSLFELLLAPSLV